MQRIKSIYKGDQTTRLCESLFAFGFDIDKVTSNYDLFQLSDVDLLVVFSLPLLAIFVEPFGITVEMEV